MIGVYLLSEKEERRVDNRYLFEKLEQCIRLQVKITNQQLSISEELKEIKQKMSDHMVICDAIDHRLQRMEKYEFAAKTIAWFVGGCAMVIAGIVHFWNDVRSIFVR